MAEGKKAIGTVANLGPRRELGIITLGIEALQVSIWMQGRVYINTASEAYRVSVYMTQNHR